VTTTTSAITRALQSATGESLFCRVWSPAGPPRAALVLVHGMSEHSGRYEHVGRFLADRGIVVYAHDHLGHGRSGGRRGWVARFDDLLDDVDRVHATASGEWPALPLFLLGHSMGGLVAAAYVLERPRKPDYLVLSGPAIVPLLAPGERTIDPTRLSKDPDVQRAYMEDPLVLRERVHDELFVRLADGLAYLPGRAREIRMPTLLLHGGDDPLCSAEGARMWLESSPDLDLTVHVYPSGRHEMMNETNKDEVLADLWAWCSSRLGS
jgi:alpha-beta hydrolase superfamily lysophospholipase